MPLHPLHRDGTDTLHEDRQTIIHADQLGFYDAFVGEHLTDQAENVTNSMIFLALIRSFISDIANGWQAWGVFRKRCEDEVHEWLKRLRCETLKNSVFEAIH